MDKRRFLSELTQLKSRCSALEREQATQLKRRHGSLGRDASTMDEYASKLKTDRNLEGQQLKQQLAKVRNSVQRFRQSLNTVKANPQSANRVKALMEEVDSSVRAFKERQHKQFDQLLHEEQVLTEAIGSMEKKVEVWERQPVAVPTAAAKTRPATTTSGTRSRTAQDAAGPAASNAQPPALADFQRFLEQTGGHQGGWDSIDHQAFVQLRQRFKGKDSFTELLSARIAGKSPENVSRHESWYVEYTLLLEKKKSAIQAWRSAKMVDKTKPSEAAESVSSSDEDDTDQQELKRKKAEVERRQKKERIEKWKAEQKEQLLMEQQSALAEKRRKEADQLAREKAEREQQSVRLDEFRQKKLEEEAIRHDMQVQLKHETQELRRLATQELGVFQERDRIALEERQLKAQEVERQKLERERRLNQLKDQVAVKVSRDPSRLTKPTAGWESRRRQTVEQGSRDTNGPMLFVPHRAVPTWRQGL